MGLAVNLLLTLLLEIPIIALFFTRRKRQQAILAGTLINTISWSVAHILFFTMDINIYLVAVVLAIGEAIAFHFFLPCNWRIAILISLIANSLSFFVTQRIPNDLFQSKPDLIRTTMYSEYKPVSSREQAWDKASVVRLLK